MKKRYWAPVLAVVAAIMILAPTTFAKGQAGDTFGVNFGANRFPSGLDNATVNLTFESDTRVRLDATVQGSDVRSWTIRVYDQGVCQRPLHWVVTRPGTNGAGQSVALRVTTNTSVSLFLNPLDVQRLRAVPDARNLAVMFAGAGSGSLGSGSAYRTCALFGSGPVATTTTTTTSNTTSNTTNQTNTTSNQTNTSACVTTRTNNGTATTITGNTTVVGGTVTTLTNQTTTVGGTATTLSGTTVTVPGTTTTVLGTTNSLTTIGGVTTVVGGTTSTVPAVTTTLGGTVTTISAITTTLGGTTVTVTPVTTTGTGVVTTATGTRTSGTGTCVFP